MEIDIESQITMMAARSENISLLTNMLVARITDSTDNAVLANLDDTRKLVAAIADLSAYYSACDNEAYSLMSNELINIGKVVAV